MQHVAALMLLLLLPAALLPATQSPQPPVFRSGVDLVDVTVVVSDADGRFVPGLTALDFEIADRGVPQTITVFDRVSIPMWRPEPGGEALPVSADVSSNERPADGRLFVLVLDALHVAPANLAGVRKQATQFIDDHLGPADLAAVISPGALADASQDFTGDKARLVAAIDRFVGSKLRSATLEIEEEHQQAVVGGIMMHGGKDPSDFERADRAQSISSVLEALADHLSRVERRRKALLLFSEGIDYNTADITGSIQRSASDVQRAMHRAVGALMRSNVSLYAIDPRGLTTPDTAGEKLPFRPIPTAPRPDGSVPKIDLSEPTLDAEIRDSINTLRYVSESTGGFALVTGNDPRVAFDRIVRESSDYYALGYSPATRGKPGEFQPIRVRVNRPGTTVIARNGYVVPSPSKARAAAAAADQPQEQTNRLTFGRSPRSVAVPSAESAPAAAAPKGLHEELAWLLSSPLPVAGLPIRVHAAAFKGSEKKQVVQLVTEVRGSALAFSERGGRYESRVELASFTVDSRGRGANGRSTTIDLRLTKEEYERARSTGIRWMSQLELAPGRYQLRVAGRAPAAGTVGLVTADVDVPAFADGATMSGVAFTSANSALMVTRGQTRLASTLNTPPTVERAFVAGDRVVAAAEVYLPAAGPSATALLSRIERTDGSVVLESEEKVSPGPGPRRLPFAVPIDTASLAPGRYLLRMRLDTARPNVQSERVVPFEVVANTVQR